MIRVRTPQLAIAIALTSLVAGSSGAYPGGTPSFQTDVAPYCAGCHASVSEDALSGAGEYATKQLAANKHLAVIGAGQGAYEKLTAEQRAALIQHVKALEAASTIALEFPPQVAPGETFSVTVSVTGGAGPATAVALVDRAHRWFARPASAVGFAVVGAPTVIGPDGKPQSEWVNKRPERDGRGITFVNITGVSSDPVAGSYAKAKVVFTLRAPDKEGSYPIVGTYFYGTEKASPHGFTTTPVGRKLPRGGYTGASGRVAFTTPHLVLVKAPEATSDATPPPPGF